MGFYIKKLYASLFGLYRENARLILKVFGIKFKFRNPAVNQLADACCIPDIESLRKNNVAFPHPIGIVINPSAQIGRNCVIYQNVTIGTGRLNKQNGRSTPIIDDNVTIYANSVVIGGIYIGKNSIIGAGSIVLRDIPDNVTVAGNPAKIIKHNLSDYIV